MTKFPSRPDDVFKAFAYSETAKIGKALSAPARLVILNILCQGPRSVDRLAKHAALSVANTSQHLQVLRGAGLVDAERAGNQIIYNLASENVAQFFTFLKELAFMQSASLRQAFSEISGAPSRAREVGRDELLQKVRSGEVVVIDVRPVEEYEEGHLAGAISVPLEELEQKLADVPRNKEVIALCRGKFCVLADKAVTMLKAEGIDARRAEDGVVELKLAGTNLAGGEATDG